MQIGGGASAVLLLSKPMTEPVDVSKHADIECHTELFTVRIWREQLNNHFEWRGKVQHIANRDTRYFRSWEMLIEVICEMLAVDT
jgi:hypothetical protein